MEKRGVNRNKLRAGVNKKLQLSPINIPRIFYRLPGNDKKKKVIASDIRVLGEFWSSGGVLGTQYTIGCTFNFVQVVL
jgi:hypothetical protein